MRFLLMAFSGSVCAFLTPHFLYTVFVRLHGTRFIKRSVSPVFRHQRIMTAALDNTRPVGWLFFVIGVLGGASLQK